MSLMRRSNWPAIGSGSLLSDFFDNDRFFDTALGGNQMTPAVNVKETDKGFDVEVAAPGLSKKDFMIDIDNHRLTISSEKKDEKEEKEDGYTRKEFNYSSFSRTFTLPENVDEDDVKAKYEDGVLRLSLIKKPEKSKVKKAIEIR
jgi:HSP20 family protein